MFAREARGGGLWLEPCWSVHTWFMRFCVDLVFVGRDGRVAAVHRGVGPWRVVSLRGARAVLEVPCGAVPGVCEGWEAVVRAGG